jgi:hypothetical protein
MLVGASAFDGVTLRGLAVHLLVPVLAFTAGLIGWSPSACRLAWRGLVAGMAATFLYDLFRWSFLWLGWMDVDPIVHIGTALGLAPGWLFGYLWRYLGNGGGMGVAFFALGLRGVRPGILYGLFVCGGLFLVLLVSPHGQQMLFPLNGATVVMASIGHVIYGGVLGELALVSRRARGAVGR